MNLNRPSHITEDLTVVTFWIAQQHYALALPNVLQIVRLPALTIVPGAPPSHSGLLNLRGNRLPVLNGRVLLGMPAATTIDNQLIIVEIEDHEFALLVDAVDRVRRYPAAACVPLQRGSALVRNIIQHGDETVMLLETDGLISHVAN